MEEIIFIVDELGIKHPTDPKTHEPIVRTTGFLLTVDKGEGLVELARTIKMKDELLKERVIEKFEIEGVHSNCRNRTQYIWLHRKYRYSEFYAAKRAM